MSEHKVGCVRRGQQARYCFVYDIPGVVCKHKWKRVNGGISE